MTLTNFNPASYDSEGNLIVPRHGIRIALWVALADGLAFALLEFFGDRKWHEIHPGSGASSYLDPLWMYCLWAALPIVPWVLATGLLSFRREDAIAAGAGVAGALFVNALLAGLACAVGLFFLGSPYYAKADGISILIFIACCLWILIAAFRIAAKAGWGVFFFAGAVTLFCMAVAFHFLWEEDNKLDWEREMRKRGAAVEILRPFGSSARRVGPETAAAGHCQTSRS